MGEIITQGKHLRPHTDEEQTFPLAVQVARGDFHRQKICGNFSGRLMPQGR
jgi:hypothetical protein